MNQTVCGHSRGNKHRCLDFREFDGTILCAHTCILTLTPSISCHRTQLGINFLHSFDITSIARICIGLTSDALFGEDIDY